jgi:HD-GYP domain-containing protein (c-di-GMP phosphodiesterase class II)
MGRWGFVLALVVATMGWAPAASADATRRLLILQSYNERFSWVASVNRGLEQGLSGPGWDLWYEYLDAKNLGPDFDFSAYDRFFVKKYEGKHFDVVVTVDDPAYDYFVKNRDRVFPGVKAVALGLNGPPRPRLADVGYVVENPDYAKTLNLALKLNPAAGVVHVVLDRSASGLLIRRQIEAETLDRPVRFDWIDEGTARQVEARTSALVPGDILFYGVYFNPDDGYESNDAVLERIRSRVSIPVYSFWLFNLGLGSIGGYLYDGTRMGLEGARLVQDLCAGAAPEFWDRPLSSWAFQWQQVRTYGLREADFPADSRFEGKPEDDWRVTPTTAAAVGAVFLVLVIVTVLVLVNLRTQRALVASGREMIATQRELMHNLGNVIENRSNETATHVQRITVLALRLADLAGLSPGLRDQLGVCAPMHDIGKVGIPDAILKKPGMLTDEEREVMKTHTGMGYSFFRSSSNPMIQAAARIALEHHEHWDGSGYPDGKAGEQIDLLARVVSVVDVFDALLSERTYKAAWEPERVREFLTRESGKLFDPTLAALVLGHWDEFLALRASVAAGA